MAKRLQVILQDPDYREIQRMARSRHVGRNRARVPLRFLAVTFVDSNIPMYLVGSPHPHKTDAQQLVERIVSNRERLVTDAEALQEILHRYVAIHRPDAVQPAFDALLGITDQVFVIDRAAVERAKEIVLGHPRLS